MTKKGNSKKDKKRIFMAFIILVGLISALVGTLFNDWAQILDNKKSVSELNSQYTELLENEASLESEVTKLQDSDYVARYAREKFLYSKDGEMIIRLPEEKSE